VGIARGERGTGGEEGGVLGGNIVGGNPVEVTPMKEASLLSSGRDDQRGASLLRGSQHGRIPG